MKTLYGIALALFIFLAVGVLISGKSTPAANANATSTPTCTVNSFSVEKTKALVEYDYAKLTGIVTNHCAVAVGIQLKWTAYNSDGTIAFSQDFWPAGMTNIPPGADYPFEMMNTAPLDKWTYRVEPIALYTW